ncbi:MAG: HAMP domain-containing histidine kinase [Labilithrix sp.]|nr:HAMP domain-containing histidine kinase [Labilithrix sp.]
MKLRHRLALYFALGSSALLITSRLVTLASFRRVQEYELDRGLKVRAREEGSAIALLGRKALEAEYDATGDDPDPLEQLVTYGALYRADGSLVADTPSFANAPSPSELGIAVEPTARHGDCFDFEFRGSTLRGVIVEVRGAKEKEYLLVAASRRDMDADARQLLEVGWWVLAVAAPASLVIGWWFGRRTTRGIEALATSARRVAAGELDVRFEAGGGGGRDEEVAALAAAMGEMDGRLKTLVETERRFASHAAHELRSPLAVLRGELELALRRPRQGSEYEAFLRDALDDTKRLANLAENLLVVARSGTRGASPPPEALYVRELVQEAISSSRARTPEAPRVAVEGDDACVRGVRGDLVRMIRNLVDNAIDHGAGDAPVLLRLTSTEARAGIIVENDGPGVAEEDRDRIFEHFHRGADARAISGAGLGLGIAREVAVRHGGELTLDSIANPTRFIVRLPLATAVAGAERDT